MATESCTHWRLWLWGLTQLTSPAPLQPWESTVTLSKLSPCLLQENRKSYFRFGHRQQETAIDEPYDPRRMTTHSPKFPPLENSNH